MEIDSYIRWLASNRGARLTRLRRLEEEWLYDKFAYEVEVTWNNRRFLGHAIDASESLALTKATSELIERIAVVHNRLPNSSGVAAHTSFESAASNAATELVERDAFFCHWLTQTPAQESILIERPEVLKAIKKFSLHSVEIRFAKLRSVGGLSAVVCGAFGSQASEPFGVILGLGCSKSFGEAIEKAFFEVVQNAAIWLFGKSEMPLSMADLAHPFNPMSHFRLGLNQHSDVNCRWLFSTEFETVTDENQNVELQFIELMLPDEFGQSPFTIVRAEAPLLQHAFFGPTRDDVVNFERLARFMSGSSFKVNRQIHLLG